MAVNMTKVKEVGADKYIDTDKHTWSTEGFLNTVDALYKGGYENVAAIYCSGQGGDQGTRAIINNMYGGTFTDAAHTKYTADSAENIKAIQTLYDAKGVNFDPSINGGEEITLFRNGTLQMAFCWNIAQQLNADTAAAGQTIRRGPFTEKTLSNERFGDPLGCKDGNERAQTQQCAGTARNLRLLLLPAAQPDLLSGLRHLPHDPLRGDQLL